jgi:hypothetical protein
MVIIQFYYLFLGGLITFIFDNKTFSLGGYIFSIAVIFICSCIHMLQKQYDLALHIQFE